MKLVDYSDSDASDSEAQQDRSPPPAPKPEHAPVPSKLARKQIIVDLPKPSQAEIEGPVKKRLRTDGGGGGLFAILPPPKRSKPTVNGIPKEGGSNGVQTTEQGGETKSITEETHSTTSATPTFTPRSTVKKGKAIPKSSEDVSTTSSISLFPLGPDRVSKPTVPPIISNPSTYEPLITQATPDMDAPSSSDPSTFVPDTTAPPPSSTMSTTDLDNFAAHILEGRHRKKRTIQIVDYNATEIYAQNAADKASGLLQEQIAPVRAIGTGRHQITQLLNNVQDQRESLEEAFAKGRRVRKESGAKYGW
jgi:hypothetical protein